MKKLFIITLIILTSLTQIALSQERKSIHQIEWEEYHRLDKHVTIDVFDEDIIPLQPIKSTQALSKKVFGFLPDWEYPQAMENLRFDLLTHIAAFDFIVSADGFISNPAGWPWTDLINKAHDNGVKVILTAVNFDGTEINNIINNETAKNNFFNNLKSKISLYQLDGVNIDFESLNIEDRGAAINNFMVELTGFIHNAFPESEVSFDGPAVNWGGHWDFAGLANSCDYIFIMGYAFSGGWSDYAASTAPLTGGTYNITNTVQSQYSAVVNSTPQKLILGVPYYGQEFQTVDNQAHAQVTDKDYTNAIRFRSAKSGFNTHGVLWDTPTSSPWYSFQRNSNWYQVWCDNQQSMDDKFDLVDSNNLLGVGMWALNYDGKENDFWNVIIEHYGDGEPVPAEPLRFALSSYNQNSLKVRFSEVEFANGYWIYYSNDGLEFTDSTYFMGSDSILTGLDSNALYFVKVRAQGTSGIGPATGVLAATTNMAIQSTSLIVDGFDRQSSTNNSRDFIRMHAEAFFYREINFSSATNEAIINKDIDLSVYAAVDWILGDESTKDDTFNPVEQAIVKDFLKQGGNLFVSGAEIGWDLGRTHDLSETGDKDFYNNYLKAEYIDDAPNGQFKTYNSIEALSGKLFDGLPEFTFDYLGDQGTYAVDWPDAINAINGAQNILRYKDAPASNIAALAYEGTFPGGTTEGKLVYFGFPFETIYPIESRQTVISFVFDFFEGNISRIPETSATPQKFTLYQNYPNPFNPTTKIRFYLDKADNFSVKIYDITGRDVALLKQGQANKGYHIIEFDASNYASGIYIYEVNFGQQILRNKMTLIK